MPRSRGCPTSPTIHGTASTELSVLERDVRRSSPGIAPPRARETTRRARTALRVKIGPGRTGPESWSGRRWGGGEDERRPESLNPAGAFSISEKLKFCSELREIYASADATRVHRPGIAAGEPRRTTWGSEWSCLLDGIDQRQQAKALKRPGTEGLWG
jgi:hypothetical protein